MKRHQNYFKALSPFEDCACWFCKSKTRYALYEKGGSEIWACINCLEKKLSPRRFRNLMTQHSTFQKRLKKEQKLRVKKEKVGSSDMGERV